MILNSGAEFPTQIHKEKDTFSFARGREKIVVISELVSPHVV